MAKGLKVEITFSGGCVVVIRDPRWRPENPKGGVDILLVDTSLGMDHGQGHAEQQGEVPEGDGQGHGEHHEDMPNGADEEHSEHFPRLTYVANQHWSLLNKNVRPGAQAEKLRSYDITNLDVKIDDPDQGLAGPFDLKWCNRGWPDGGQGVPRGRRNWKCLDWLVPAEVVGLAKIDEGKATSAVSLPPGKLRARAVTRNLEGGPSYPAILWKFEDKNGNIVLRQAMAEQLVYTYRLPRVNGNLKLRFTDRTTGKPRRPIILNPHPGNKIQLSITNLPGKFGGSNPKHFGMYANLSPNPAKTTIAIPEKGDWQTENGICPLMVFHDRS